MKSGVFLWCVGHKCFLGCESPLERLIVPITSQRQGRQRRVGPEGRCRKTLSQSSLPFSIQLAMFCLELSMPKVSKAFLFRHKSWFSHVSWPGKRQGAVEKPEPRDYRIGGLDSHNCSASTLYLMR